MNLNLRNIKQLLDSGSRKITCEGSWGSYPAYITGELSETCSSGIVVVHPHIEDSDCFCDEIRNFTNKYATLLPAWEGEKDLSGSIDEIGSERLKVSLKLSKLKKGDIISTSIQALSQPLPAPQLLKKESLSLSAGKTIEPELLLGWLCDQGYESCDAVDAPGDFARRGGIVDIYPPVANITLKDKKQLPNYAQPIRLEFFGDEIETIRIINLDNQTSGADVKSADIYSTVSSEPFSKTFALDLIPKETTIILIESSEQAEVLQTYLMRVEKSDGFNDFGKIYNSCLEFTAIEICRFANSTNSDNISLNVKSIERFKSPPNSVVSGSKNTLKTLAEYAENDGQVLLLCESAGQIKRTRELILSQYGSIPDKLEVQTGYLKAGFLDENSSLVVIAHHEIFAQNFIHRRSNARRLSSNINSLEDLKEGCYVVHLTSGIARYQGTKTLEQNGNIREYLILEFAEKAKIYVPVANISLVHKYVGASSLKPRLSVLGSKKWANQKQKVFDAVKDMAVEMLEMQAKRIEAGGFQFAPDCDWQREFEDSFPYQETADQMKSIEEIKADMHKPIAMDRLLCGDVGYGKTEVAMRAAFKAVLSGKQVAVLVPTTILSVQHEQTFQERMAGFPVRIAVVNRFVSKKQATLILEQCRKGNIDILIGTHRLLSKDVGFKDLGLLIVDEEQRFGVEHKEQLKQLRLNVDILTLSATPIPRTLHMALIGIRDISTLSTPPLDRRAVSTSIHKFDLSVIKQVVSRELSREGQVFFLHNTVRTIEQMANELRALFKGAVVKVAHGQMHKKDLEQAMLDFVMRKTDILVCSTIIESGIDVSNANTIVINDADRLGLAQLHQLRGRVGRFKRKAYAEMLIPADRPIKPIAARRLKAIEEYSELGAGFKIALQDLEIRGAGNLLGSQQSGHIDTVGYELYCKMLTNAVQDLSNEPSQRYVETVMDLGFTTYIPKSYIPSDKQRLGAYRKAAEAATIDDIIMLSKELRDIFGKLPEEVEVLMDVSKVRICASQAGIEYIKANSPDLIFTFEKKFDNSKAIDLFAKIDRRITVADPRNVHIRLTKNHFEPKTILAFLRKMFKLYQ